MKQNKQLFTSSLLFTLILVVWPVFMAVSQPQGNVEERFQWIMQNQALFKLQFFLAFLIGPALIYMMISQLNLLKNEFGRTDVIGIIFLAAYLVLCSISYGAQFLIVPGLIEQKLVNVAHAMYFDSGTSFSYFLNQTGYFFWAMGTLVLFSKFIVRRGAIKAITIIYMLSATLSVIAFAGLIIESKILNLMTFVSGIILLPVGIISITWSLKSDRVVKKGIMEISSQAQAKEVSRQRQ